MSKPYKIIFALCLSFSMQTWGQTPAVSDPAYEFVKQLSAHQKFESTDWKNWSYSYDKQPEGGYINRFELDAMNAWHPYNPGFKVQHQHNDPISAAEIAELDTFSIRFRKKLA